MLWYSAGYFLQQLCQRQTMGGHSWPTQKDRNPDLKQPRVALGKSPDLGLGYSCSSRGRRSVPFMTCQGSFIYD